MKLPRNLSGRDLVHGLRRVGYVEKRKKGDHVIMTTQQNEEHHVTVPMHNPVRVGTLAAILDSVAGHMKIGRNELLQEMRL